MPCCSGCGPQTSCISITRMLSSAESQAPSHNQSLHRINIPRCLWGELRQHILRAPSSGFHTARAFLTLDVVAYKHRFEFVHRHFLKGIPSPNSGNANYMADSPPQGGLVILPALVVQIPDSRDSVENGDANYLHWVSEYTRLGEWGCGTDRTSQHPFLGTRHRFWQSSHLYKDHARPHLLRVFRLLNRKESQKKSTRR